MAEKIFISYRRDDSETESARLVNALRAKFGRDSVFIDTSSVVPGEKWPLRIFNALSEAEIVVVIIGADWLRAGSDEWGLRPIDQKDDWVRLEIEEALRLKKQIIPLRVREAKLPPPAVLPLSLASIPHLQSCEIRDEHWEHDLNLFIAQLRYFGPDATVDATKPWPYCRSGPVGAQLMADDVLQQKLADELKLWVVRKSPLPEDTSIFREELFREFSFSSFEDAMLFMQRVALGCSAMNHHPRWENIWRTVRVYLSTWEIEHHISDRDTQLARYFDRAYDDFIVSKH
jgi:pterin-4a-carbinolamine dehydratase